MPILVGLVLVAALVALLVLSWKDPAEPAFVRCMELEAKGDILEAVAACEAAFAADRTSKSGKAASMMLARMAPTAAQIRREQAERKARAEAGARQARADELRRRIARSRAPLEDEGCVLKGKPPVGYAYRGGTTDEIAELAKLDGCVPSMTDGLGVNHGPWACCTR